MNGFPTDDRDYQTALPAATEMARRLPYVRVLVVDPDNIAPNATPEQVAERRRRHQQHVEEALGQGKLRPEHESGKTRAEEARLKQEPALYFHAGRPSSDYGMMAFVLDIDVLGVKATPFGLGNLFCGKSDAEAGHACLFPVAHGRDDDGKAAFVDASTWSDDWRDRAAQYLAAYFGSDLMRYFGEGAEARPTRPHPTGLVAHPKSEDWRAWTIELRVFVEVDLLAAARDGKVLRCAMDRWLDVTLQNRAVATGRLPAELYPVVYHCEAVLDRGADLPEPPDVADTHNYGKLFERLNQWVAERVLGA